MTDTPIYKYAQLYVGFKQEHPTIENPDPPPLAFATPYGTDKAAIKRMGTVDAWTHGYHGRKWYLYEFITGGDNNQYSGYQPAAKDPSKPRWQDDNAITIDPKPSEVIDNVPLRGYRIPKMVRRSVTDNVVWRVQDPRGWEVEISSQNLYLLIDECGITAGGEILVECIWLRIGAQNWLVPTACEVAINAKEKV